jgi:hypothetical protein
MKTNESKASIRLFFLKTQLFKTQGEKKFTRDSKAWFSLRKTSLYQKHILKNCSWIYETLFPCLFFLLAFIKEWNVQVTLVEFSRGTATLNEGFQVCQISGKITSGLDSLKLPVLCNLNLMVVSPSRHGGYAMGLTHHRCVDRLGLWPM